MAGCSSVQARRRARMYPRHAPSSTPSGASGHLARSGGEGPTWSVAAALRAMRHLPPGRSVVVRAVLSDGHGRNAEALVRGREAEMQAAVRAGAAYWAARNAGLLTWTTGGSPRSRNPSAERAGVQLRGKVRAGGSKTGAATGCAPKRRPTAQGRRNPGSGERRVWPSATLAMESRSPSAPPVLRLAWP